MNYDDQNWIYANQHVLGGISLSSLLWAVSGAVNGNWCPLTNLTFLLEGHFIGARPAFSHLVEVIIHTTNALLVFWLSQTLFGKDLRAAIGTILFAIHPMNVEAVCWISDRKGLLSACLFFMMLRQYTGLCYH